MNTPRKPTIIESFIVNCLFVSAITAFGLVGYRVGTGVFNWNMVYQLVPFVVAIAGGITYIGNRKRV